ncbi:DUF4159 domain-containing protein [Halalkalibaculum sp. DA3122]|uniref:DUF4159 domain-containing protein n=1 Tax=unclassified Halalkalibaculum TaxID=2964617 RepID=UPI0037551D2F
MIQKIIVVSISIFFVTGFPHVAPAQSETGTPMARIKYRGGGDWYNDPSAFRNLLEFANQQIPVTLDPEYDDVALGSRDLHQYPFAFLTGHGTIAVNEAEARNLREYLDNGGFLYIDDDYGLDDNFRKMLDQVYPDEELVELPFDHPIYHQVFDFPEGLPKVHEHDNKPPQGFALFRNGRMVAFYTYESNLADGWANPEVHNNPEPLRQKALQMGTNILVYALTSGR